MRLTDRRGVELIIDPIGGGNWKKDYQALRATGRVGVFGLSTVAGNRIRGILLFIKSTLQAPRYQPVPLFNGNKGVFGLNLGHLFHEREKIGNWMNAILRGVEEGWVRPHVGKTFRFSEVAQAHAYMESRSNIGKIILIP
jgi:NADPH:quinone reductase-like Zn-dependent oxidoreductase